MCLHVLLPFCLLHIVSCLDWIKITDHAAWVNRSGFSAVSFHDNIVITGGANTTSIWQTSDGINWNELSDSTGISDRTQFPTVVYNDSMISMGGCSLINGAHNNDVWSSKDGKKWIQINPSSEWTGRCTHQAVTHKNSIILMGGHAANSTFNSYMNDVWSSNDAGKTWKELTPSAPWHKRDGFGSVVLNDVIYIFGGHSGYHTFNPAFNDVWKSNDGIEWVEVTSSASWIPRVGFQYTVWNDSIVILGGYNNSTGTNIILNDTWTSKDGKKWTQLQTNNVFQSTWYGAAVTFKHNIYVMAGISTVTTYPYSDQNDVWILN
eukprot:125812_1